MLYFGVYDCDTIHKVIPVGLKPILVRVGSYEGQYKKIEDIRTLNIITNDVLRKEDLDFNCMNNLEDFIIDNYFDEILVHCDAGMARSSAIMIIISKIIKCKQIEDIVRKDMHLFPNKFLLEYNVTKYKNMEINKIYYRNPDIYPYRYSGKYSDPIGKVYTKNGKSTFSI